MAGKKQTFKAKVVKYAGPGGWYFVTVPQKISDTFKKASAGKTVGWGYIKITATVGKTTWSTTLFPTKNGGPCLLAIKAAVRKKEEIEEGDTVAIILSM
jgi:Domain of unknown function (DUF1905)